MLYLWKIERTGSWGYDEYSAAVVVARTEDEARQIHPNPDYGSRSSWPVAPAELKVTKLATVVRGSDLKAGAVVLASFHAG